jgi:hypothetical protein
VPHEVQNGNNVRIGSDKPAKKVKPKGILEKTKELYYSKRCT